MNDTTQSGPSFSTIQEGRFYVTRSGRTVGPIARNRGEKDVFGPGRAFPWVVPAQPGHPTYSVTNDGRCYRGSEFPNDLVSEVADDAVSIARPEQPTPASAPTASAPAAPNDVDLLAAVLGEASREAEAMTARAAPTKLAIARIVGCGYPLGDAMAAIAMADQMAFAGLTQQAADILNDAIVALAVASVVIREGRE